MISETKTMSKQTGFDNEKYLEEQSNYIVERAKKFGKLYLEFGGKLLYDFHIFDVFPWDPDLSLCSEHMHQNWSLQMLHIP